MKTKRLDIHIIARIIALYSFAIGILIVFSNFEQPQFISEGVGLLFVIMAFMLNASIFVLLLINALLNPSKLKTIAKSIGIIILNIPIAIGCISFAFYIGDFERITFVNATGSEIADVKLSGCNPKDIGSISNTEIFEEWINIDYGCNLLLTYKIDGVLKTDTIYDSYYSSIFKGRSYYYIEKR